MEVSDVQELDEDEAEVFEGIFCTLKVCQRRILRIDHIDQDYVVAANRKDSLIAEGAEGLHVDPFVERVELPAELFFLQPPVVLQQEPYCEEWPSNEKDCWKEVAGDDVTTLLARES